MKTILVVAGGTGGHIFPALAVAEEFLRAGYEVHWLGANYGLETKLVPEKYIMHKISMRGLRRSGTLAKLMMPLRLLSALFQTRKIFQKVKPGVVLAMGGYVAAPAGIMAWLKRIPLVIHEQNSKAGLTNRLLVRFAKLSFAAFPGALPKQNTQIVGNPVRKELLNVPEPQKRYNLSAKKLRLLVIGGSQGARAINDCLVEVWKRQSLTDKVEVWHQTGQHDFDKVNKAYQNLAVEARVEPFIKDMSRAYQWADLLICRAGALTVSEVAAVGVASVFIPYPYAVDNHQYYNAEYLAAHQAALIIPQAEISALKLEGILCKFVADRQSLLNMAQSARKLAATEAANKIAMQCLQIALIHPTQK